jgi:NADH-quinone oxidoreductase subunit C
VDHGASLEALYIIYNPSTHAEEVLSVKLDPVNPAISTVAGIYPAADWHERELAEMFGIDIRGRKMKRLLLERWDGADAPLRKAFTWKNKRQGKV